MNSACVRLVPGNRLPEQALAAPTEAAALPPVTIELRRIGLPPNLGARDYFPLAFQSVAGPHFAAVSGANDPQPPLKLELVFEDTGSIPAAILAGTLFGLSLMILPMFVWTGYTLDANVLRGSEVLGTYHYEDRITAWLLFPITGISLPEPGNPVIDNMIRTLVGDLQKDFRAGRFAPAKEEARCKGAERAQKSTLERSASKWGGVAGWGLRGRPAGSLRGADQVGDAPRPARRRVDREAGGPHGAQ